jgi:ubiquinone/menaquinone biosynthesis C-methylase UbiE
MNISDYDAKRRYRDGVAASYTARRLHGPRWQWEQRAMKAALAQLPPRRLFLDLPFGTGRFAEFYVAGDHSVIGVDISEDMLRASLRERMVPALSPLLVQADGERIPLADNAVDYVVCTRLFNWLPERVRRSMLQEFVRVAREGILLQIRVSERLSPQEFAWNLAGMLLHKARNAPLRSTRALSRRVVAGTRWLLPNGRVAPAAETQATDRWSGYTVPSVEQFGMLLSSLALAPQKVTRLHKTFDHRNKIIYEMRLYRLHPIA